MHEEYLRAIKTLRTIYGKNEKDNFELDKIGKDFFGEKFIGAFPWDLLPMKNGYSVINTDDSTKAGVHWVGIYKDNKNIYVYDSFGRHTEHILPEFYKELIKSGYKVTDSEHTPEQSNYQEDCGLRAIAWLLMVDLFGIKKALTI
jgi:hypothetical protein